MGYEFNYIMNVFSLEKQAIYFTFFCRANASVRTIRTIKKGEEILDNYGYHYDEDVDDDDDHDSESCNDGDEELKTAIRKMREGPHLVSCGAHIDHPGALRHQKNRVLLLLLTAMVILNFSSLVIKRPTS